MTDGLAIFHVDAFTRTPYSGNPAAVVIDAADLEESEMATIAEEMNLSETAFLLPTARKDADLRIRWFTPTTEVDICGHGTVATFHAAMEEGRLAQGTYRMECRAGVLPIDLRRDQDGLPVVSMGLPVPDLDRLEVPPARIAEAIGSRPGDITQIQPMMRAGSWALVPMKGLREMRPLRPDAGRLRILADETGLRSVIALTTETVDPGSAVHIRMFAPAEGIDEDPVTGSAQGPVAAWLVANGILPPGGGATRGGPIAYTAEQGDLIGRRGRISVVAETDGARITSITIRGSAVTVMRGSIARPRSARTG